jgi:hypothetical protein
LTEEQKTDRKRIESDWEYEECKIIIYATIDAEFKPTSDDQKLREGWGSWMMRGGGLFRPRTSSYDTTKPDESTSEKIRVSENFSRGFRRV